jgi:uncharacterized membrane protein YhhN
MNRMTTPEKSLFYVALAFAVIYVASPIVGPLPGGFAIKAVPALALSVLILTAVGGLAGKLLFVALLFCAAGDVALALEGEQFFVIGLVFFLIAQLFFISTFARELKWRRSRLPVVAVFAVYAAIMALILKPSLGELMMPVFVYVGVITTMGIFAALRAAESKVVLYGAVSFIISDSLIAINEFAASIPASSYIIMVTYYSALFLISIGYVQDRRRLSAAAHNSQD